jgi:hypothetical protein
MKKIILTILFLAASLGYTLEAQECNAKNIAKKCKNNLKPFNYDGYSDNPFIFKKTEQTIEVEFTAYAGQEYKLVFCSSGFKEDVKVNIYDRTKKNPKRQKVYDNSSGIDNLFWSFEPKKTGTYYIEYTIPAAAEGDLNKDGCIVLMVGYK